VLLALADDATGALEVGGELAPWMQPVRVWFGDSPPSSGFIQRLAGVVINTRSRHVDPADAENQIRSIARRGAARVFKKTDSTLRGNIAAEFRGLLQACPGRRIVYAPAYPDQGRVVIGGELFVHGKPLADTEFASDPLNPVRSGNIPELLAGNGLRAAVAEGPAQLAKALDQAGCGEIVVCDGRSNTDLREIAAVLRVKSPASIAAGASVFAGYWVAKEREAIEFRLPTARRCLVVNGSLHPQSRRQVEWAAAAGWTVTHCADERVPKGDANWIVLTAVDSGHGEPLEVARHMGTSIRHVIEAGAYDALVVFGGDTLDEILRALGCGAVEPVGQIMPGIPVSRIEFGGRSITWITKAGGFGGDDVLGQIRKNLESSE
jgi:uncharacterized protein YgbK (DUF1537 family)